MFQRNKPGRETTNDDTSTGPGRVRRHDDLLASGVLMGMLLNSAQVGGLVVVVERH